MPLTVSPFVSLPTALPLPYTYKALSSTLPPSSTSTTTANGEVNEKPKFIVSSTGHAAHPDDIIASCRALQTHLEKLGVDAQKTISDWENNIRERELAEKRRVAPGWLDSDERILEPKRTDGDSTNPQVGTHSVTTRQSRDVTVVKRDDVGSEIDRAFGTITLR